MVILTLTEKGGEPRQLTFDKEEVVIGRVTGNDVVLAKGNVSKRHCRIYLQDGQVSIEDLKSTNGTYVNGRKIAETTMVSTADKIYVGDFVIRVDSASEAHVPTPAPPQNEAGSLSTALKRPPPAPPPPPPMMGRPTASVRTLEDDGRGSGRIPAPPPPLPPPRAPSPMMDEENEEDAAPPSFPPTPVAADIDLDDEPLAPPPKLQPPPLKPAVAARDDEEDDDEDKVPTATRDRSSLPAGAVPVPADFPPWLRKALEIDGATAVYVTGDRIEVERNGKRERVPGAAPDAGGIRQFASRGLPRPDEDASLFNVTLPDGSHLSAILPPTVGELCAAISRPLRAHKTLKELTSSGAMSKEMLQVIEACTGTHRNVLVAGDRRALEALVPALADGLGEGQRVVAIVDRVLPRNGHASWIRVTAETHMPDLLPTAIALRPDYLFIEVATLEIAAELVQECALGQDGTFAVIAGRSAHDALTRLQALATPTLGIGVRELIAESFDVVVHVSTLSDGSVRVLEIAEPKLDGEGRLVAEPLLTWRPEEGRSGGKFATTGTASRLGSTLAARGTSVPASVLRR